MSEENNLGTTPETTGDADKELNEELEQLRTTFQDTYNQTASEAENASDEVTEDDTQPDTEEEMYGYTDENESSEPKKAKKRMAAGHIVCLVIMIIALLSTATLGMFAAVVISEPDTADYMSNVLKASSTDDYSEKVTYLEAALESCENTTILASYKQELIEQITVYTCYSDGYAAAQDYFDENGSDDYKTSPKTSEFKLFVEVADKVDDIGKNAYDTVVKAAEGDSEPDFESLAKELGANKLILDDTIDALKSIYDGYKAALNADSEEKVQEASKNYLAAYSTFSDMGATSQMLLEQDANMLYKNGYVYEASVVISNYMTEDMTSAPLTDEFSSVQEGIENIAKFTGDIYALASDAYKNGKKSTDDFADVITGDGITDGAKLALGKMVGKLVGALENEADKNLTAASSTYSLMATAATTLGIDAKGISWKSAEIMLKLGDTQSAYETITTNITEDIAKADTTHADLYNTISGIYNAQSAASQIFYAAYQNYYYYGTALDKDSINSDLDALLTENSSDWQKGFVDYYKYITEMYTDNDAETAQKYLDEYVSIFKDYPLLYCYDLIASYLQNSDYDNAWKTVDVVLDINKADDYAGKSNSLRARMSGDVDKALEIAVTSMELSGTTNYAAYEAALCYVINGEYEKAASIASDLISNGLSYDLVDLIKVIEHFYTEPTDETISANFKSAVETIDNAIEQYSVELSSTAQAIIDGTSTAKDALMTGTYNFS